MHFFSTLYIYRTGERRTKMEGTLRARTAVPWCHWILITCKECSTYLASVTSLLSCSSRLSSYLLWFDWRCLNKDTKKVCQICHHPWQTKKEICHFWYHMTINILLLLQFCNYIQGKREFQTLRNTIICQLCELYFT